MAPIEPISATAATASMALQSQAQGLVATQPEAAVKRFEALMARSDGIVPSQHAVPAPVGGGDAVNPVVRVLTAQESALRDIELRVHEFQANAPGLTMQETVSKGIELGHALAQVTSTLTATTSVAQGGNRGLQSLLKNQ